MVDFFTGIVIHKSADFQCERSEKGNFCTFDYEKNDFERYQFKYPFQGLIKSGKVSMMIQEAKNYLKLIIGAPALTRDARGYYTEPEILSKILSLERRPLRMMLAVTYIECEILSKILSLLAVAREIISTVKFLFGNALLAVTKTESG